MDRRIKIKNLEYQLELAKKELGQHRLLYRLVFDKERALKKEIAEHKKVIEELKRNRVKKGG